MAPATVGVTFQVTPVLVVPVTSATRLAVCPSARVLELVLKVTITAPCRTLAAREKETRRRNREADRFGRTGILYLNMLQTPRPK